MLESTFLVEIHNMSLSVYALIVRLSFMKLLLIFMYLHISVYLDVFLFRPSFPVYKRLQTGKKNLMQKMKGLSTLKLIAQNHYTFKFSSISGDRYIYFEVKYYILVLIDLSLLL